MRILVTNDDGIDSLGLHELARSLKGLGDVTVVAPDREYSGAGAALGSVHLIRPEVHDAHIDGIETSWSVSGPPGLCVIYARLGLFGDPFDLVVSGINPGINVGRSVYHSGTIGAALTARNGGITGIAISQAVTDWGVEGQASDEVLDKQIWSSAAEVARIVTSSVIESPPSEASVLNVNIPNLPLNEIAGWRSTKVGFEPMRSLSKAELTSKPGHAGSYKVDMNWGDPSPLPGDTDGGAVMEDHVSLTWLGYIPTQTPPQNDPVAQALDKLFTQ
ncbi:MAG TPA: 5'/3'-nucleotidase SurE [Acidimicrobiales bacterium]|nr:5'/3'-nucleotidase SurE [Acidimicrobiales bacterium]|tara:strand:+ start:6481 stop:7305 length:825 start_codon:yes stop_codon:yes gene_type:complete